MILQADSFGKSPFAVKAPDAEAVGLKDKAGSSRLNGRNQGAFSVLCL
jgi:hypothetical protein